MFCKIMQILILFCIINTFMMSVVLVGPRLKDHIPCDGYNAGIKITLIRCHHIYLHCKIGITPRVLGLLLCHVRHYHCHEYNQPRLPRVPVSRVPCPQAEPYLAFVTQLGMVTQHSEGSSILTSIMG